MTTKKLGKLGRYDVVVPPFANIALVEYRDRIELTPLFWFREFVGMGKFKAEEVGPKRDGKLHPLFEAAMGDREIWVITTWRRFEDGREEARRTEYLDPQATETEARKAFDRAVRFLNMSRKELEDLSKCFAASDEDLDYIESRFPDVIRAPDPRSTDDHDLYQARLRVLAGLQPKTVELMHRADMAPNQSLREEIEWEAVQAFFADMAHYWTEDLMHEWQRSNPIGTEWMLHFARVLGRPKREIDSIDHELALNWLRQKYNLLTAEELSAAIERSTGERIAPATIKKRRERLGLTTKRPTGPRPNSEK